MYSGSSQCSECAACLHADPNTPGPDCKMSSESPARSYVAKKKENVSRQAGPGDEALQPGGARTQSSCHLNGRFAIQTRCPSFVHRICGRAAHWQHPAKSCCCALAFALVQAGAKNRLREQTERAVFKSVRGMSRRREVHAKRSAIHSSQPRTCARPATGQTCA